MQIIELSALFKTFADQVPASWSESVSECAKDTDQKVSTACRLSVYEVAGDATAYKTIARRQVLQVLFVGRPDSEIQCRAPCSSFTLHFESVSDCGFCLEYRDDIQRVTFSHCKTTTTSGFL